MSTIPYCGRGGRVGWVGLEEKAKRHPPKKENYNFGTTRPALLVKISLRQKF